MTIDQFVTQMRRLESTFGEKHFDLERLDLIKQSVMWMSADTFQAIVSHFIATFRHAPLPKDFKDAAIQERNRLPKVQVRDKVPLFSESFTSEGLKRTLVRDYPGCRNLSDAIELEREKIKIKRALEGE